MHRPLSQPIDTEIPADTQRRILAAATLIVERHTPCISLRDYLDTASDYGLQNFAARLHAQFPDVDTDDLLGICFKTACVKEKE